MERWYVIQTKPRQENLAEQNLERQGYRCFLPQIKQWQKTRGERRLVEKAFFPNYMFIYLDLYLTNSAPIRSTRGVHKMVRFGNEMLPVPDAIIESIRQHNETNLAGTNSHDFKPGQEVHIEDGAFAGLTAIFQEKRGENRALLLLHMLGNQQRVEMPMAALE